MRFSRRSFLSRDEADSRSPSVAEKLKQEGKQEMLQGELTEELEDADGNVYNRKVLFAVLSSLSAGFADVAFGVVQTWEDLKRQGLL